MLCWMEEQHELYLLFHLLQYFMSASAFTLYEKGAGKEARHAWRSRATSIGALSNITVWCYEHILSWQLTYHFHPMECVATRTQHFTLLPSNAFLCLVPLSSLKHMPSGNIIKIHPGAFSDIFHALLSEQDCVLALARVLLAPPSRH